MVNEISKKDESVKRLILKRDELKNGLKLSEQLNQLLRKLVMKKLAITTNLTQNECAAGVNIIAEVSCFQLESVVNGVGDDFSENQDEDETKFFKISYSKNSFHVYPGNRPLVCRGCKRNFKLMKGRPNYRVRVYTKHCIKECDKYKDLGVIGHCFKCKLSFLNRLSASRHVNNCHRNQRKPIKPNWMSSFCYNNCTRFIVPFNTTVNCKGCHKTFKEMMFGERKQPAFDYYVHCIEQCEEYKKLKRIRECEMCKKKFLDFISLAIHMTKTHRQLTDEKRRIWMNGGMLRRPSSDEFNTTIDCKGCGKIFKAQKAGRNFTAELDYYIHCVEQCEEYKKLNLILKCKECNKIYLNKLGYSKHVNKCIRY